MNRRRSLRGALALGAFPKDIVASAEPNLLHCTPSPVFPVPLVEGIWRSPEFPVGKHNYHVWLNVDRQLPIAQLDCDLGSASPGHQCDTPPLLDLEWKLFDKTAPVKIWASRPIKASAWSQAGTACFLGDFDGRRKGAFTLELTVKKDAGRLKDLHPYVQVVKNPGYWCWL